MYVVENPPHEIEHDDLLVKLRDPILDIPGPEAPQSSLRFDRLRYHHQGFRNPLAYDSPDNSVTQRFVQIHPGNCCSATQDTLPVRSDA